MIRRAALIALFAAGCGPGDAEIVGFWRNQTRQYLSLGADLHGIMTQTPTCTPVLSVYVTRDPFEGFSLRFEPDQRIYYPPAIAPKFQGDSFCSSKSSVPMCRFCEIDGESMSCESPEQEIVGAGAGVTHNCSWTRLTTISATITDRTGCGPRATQFECARTATVPR
jgi:hypothetical protein